MSELITNGVPQKSAHTLEQMLEDSMRYGQLRVSNMGGEWYAVISMNTNTTGTSFEIKSDFNWKSPRAAVAQCLERMHAALKKLEGCNV